MMVLRSEFVATLFKSLCSKTIFHCVQGANFNLTGGWFWDSAFGGEAVNSALDHL